MSELRAPHSQPARELLGLAGALAGLPRLALELPWLPRGGDSPVLVLPGFATGDGSTLVLRGFLTALGYRPYGWRLGRNSGDVNRLVPPVVERLDAIRGEHGRRVRLVGWSHGGVLAREAARARPDAVRTIVTLGTPVIGGPKYTAVAPRYAERGVDLDELERRIAEGNAEPLAVPVTAIYSRRDTIVAWRACLDDNPHNRVTYVEVGTTHLGLGFAAEVLRAVAHALAV